MTNDNDLASLLDTHMKNASLGDARMATLVNSMTGNPYFIHRSTLRNWRNGSTQKVNKWQQLTAVAATLQLNEEQTNALLESAGCPHIKALAAMAQEADQQFLKYWHSDTDEAAKEPDPAVSSTGASNREVTTASPQVNEKEEVKSAIPALAVPAGTWKLAGVCIAALSGVVPLGYKFYQSFNESEKLTVSGNLLLNSGFEQGITSWSSYVNDAASASFEIENEAMRIQIEKNSNKYWHIQFFQSGLEVTAGEKYTLRFRIRADKPRIIKADVTRVADPKTSLGFDHSARREINIAKEWSIETIQFEAANTASAKEGGARVLFDMGKTDPGWLELDDIKFFFGDY